jgi:metal-responsive CopG/Arc/MetJ family transcriptional regulator
MRNEQMYKAILLKLPVELANKVDEAVAELYVSRVNFIREAIRRNLRYFEQHERPAARAMRARAYK